MRKIWLLIIISILVSVCIYIFLKKDFTKTAPTLYINGNIITLNDEYPSAEAMFIKGGKIMDIGSIMDLEKYNTPDNNIVDLKGTTVMPGFIDPHTHFSISLFLQEMHDLSGFKHKNNQEVWESFAKKVKNTQKQEWILCKGLDPILVPDLTPPTIEYLDSIAPNNPVLILSQSLHSYWANSKAFELVGIHKNTPNPSDHSYYAKDENGNLNGAIVEQLAVQPFFEIIKSEVLTPKKLSAAAVTLMRNYAKNGNTTIVSVGITIQDKKPLLLFKHLSTNNPGFISNALETLGYLPKRSQNPRHFIYMRHDMAHLLPEKRGEKNDFYDIIGVKHWYDGSPYTGSMYLKDNYKKSELTNQTLHIPSNHRGNPLINKEDFEQFITKYHTKGWQIAIHAQGDAATHEVLNAFSNLKTTLDYSDSRHRIEHGLLISKKDIPRLKTLHLTPSYHINHLYYYGDALKASLLGATRTENILPLAFTKKNKIKFSLHADQPMFPSNPFRLIQTAVERKTVKGDTIARNQKIAIIDALKAMTIDAAWQIFMEDKIGSLEKGKYADFILLDTNPLQINPKNLSTIKCLKTFINGNEVLK